MYAQLGENWRKIGNSLYQKQGSDFIHVAIVPNDIKSLAEAVCWWIRKQEQDDEDE